MYIKLYIYEVIWLYMYIYSFRLRKYKQHSIVYHLKEVKVNLETEKL